MGPMTNRVKAWRCFYGLTNETNNFAIGHSDVIVLLSPILDSWVAA